MRIKQHDYLAPGANRLRRRDGVPPWGLHVCEVDDFDGYTERHADSPFMQSLRAARALRRELEQGGNAA